MIFFNDRKEKSIDSAERNRRLFSNQLKSVSIPSSARPRPGLSSDFQVVDIRLECDVQFDQRSDRTINIETNVSLAVTLQGAIPT